jgi:carbon storage regulator
VLSVDGSNVKIGIDAPREITILRMEVFEQIQRENRESAQKDLGEIKQAAALIKKRFFKE